MNIFHAQFTLGQVAEATGLPADTIKTWLRKELIHTMPSKADGPGTRRLHSFHGAMEIAVAGALMEAGVKDNSVVFHAATSFAHFGDGPLPGTPGRIPGCPFPDNLTYLAVGGGRSAEIYYRPGKDEMASIRHRLKRPEVIIMVEINSIFERVVRGLGHEPAEVMKIARHDLNLMPSSGFIES